MSVLNYTNYIILINVKIFISYIRIYVKKNESFINDNNNRAHVYRRL